MSPSTAAALSAVPVDKAGVGSAVVNTSRQLGGSIGIAFLGAVVAHEVGGQTSPEAFVHGLSVALLVAGGIALAGAVVALALVRSHAVGKAPEEPQVRLEPPTTLRKPRTDASDEAAA